MKDLVQSQVFQQREIKCKCQNVIIKIIEELGGCKFIILGVYFKQIIIV